MIKEGINHTEAHATLTPGEAYTALINQLNVLIDKYNNLVASRSESGNE